MVSVEEARLDIHKNNNNNNNVNLFMRMHVYKNLHAASCHDRAWSWSSACCMHATATKCLPKLKMMKPQKNESNFEQIAKAKKKNARAKPKPIETQTGWNQNRFCRSTTIIGFISSSTTSLISCPPNWTTRTTCAQYYYTTVIST